MSKNNLHIGPYNSRTRDFNPLFLPGTRVNYPYSMILSADNTKIYFVNNIPNPAAGWNEIKCIDIATNKLSTLTNSVTGMLVMNGGLTLRDANTILLTGRDWNGTNISNSSPTKRVIFNEPLGTWSCDTTDVQGTFSHTASTYDPFCIHSLKHSKYNINGKQAYLTGAYHNYDTLYENGLRLHYWNGTTWTDLNLRTKMPMRNDAVNFADSNAMWQNGHTPISIYEDEANGRLFIFCMGFAAGTAFSALYVLEANSSGTGLTALSGWNNAFKLVGKTNNVGSGHLDGSGLTPRIERYTRILGVESLNEFGNPIFLITSMANTIRRVDTGNCTLLSGSITTIAGAGGVNGSINDIGLSARFNFGVGGNGVIITANGTKYAIFCDSANHRIKKMNLSTLLVEDYCGDGTLGNINN